MATFQIKSSVTGANLAAHFTRIRGEIRPVLMDYMQQFADLALAEAKANLASSGKFVERQVPGSRLTRSEFVPSRGGVKLADSLKASIITDQGSSDLDAALGTYEGTTISRISVVLYADPAIAPPYAMIQEFGGTIPSHKITAVNARALMFTGYGYIPYSTWRGHGRIVGAERDQYGVTFSGTGKFDLFGNMGGGSPHLQRNVGGGTSYRFSYPKSMLGEFAEMAGAAGEAFAKSVEHGAVIQGKGYVHKTMEALSGEFRDLIYQAVHVVFGLRAPQITSVSSLRKGPGNVLPTNTQASGSI